MRLSLLGIAIGMFCCSVLPLSAATKPHPQWNANQALPVRLSQLSSLNVSSQQKLRVIGNLLGVQAGKLQIANSQILFRLGSPQASQLALQMPLGEVAVYGFLQKTTAGKRTFVVMHLEKAPSPVEQVKDRWKRVKSTSDSWKKAALWAKERYRESGQSVFLQASVLAWRKSWQIREKGLRQGGKVDIKGYRLLIEQAMEVNQQFARDKVSLRPFSSQQIMKWVQVGVALRVETAPWKKIYQKLNLVRYQGKYWTYEDYKRQEGLLQYRGAIAEFQNRWVGPRMHHFLKAIEKRWQKITPLRKHTKSHYQELVNTKQRFVLGLNRQELSKMTGYPDEVATFKLSPKPGQVFTYQLWAYGEKPHQYLCLEDGLLFYFPDTFAPLK